MKLSKLLGQRSELLRQVRLANLAFAYSALREFAQRVHRAGLRGAVTLKPVDASEERFVATLTAHECSQSMIEEHFTDEDILLFSDVVAFATGHPGFEVTFHLEQLTDDFILPMRAELERSGVELDHASPRIQQPNQPS
ncbi:MAG TPA: hypothetical protein VM029_08015 [Opitutaceae bacterium]|nr:hypothetical protein [Opitutaceae bacterium]